MLHPVGHQPPSVYWRRRLVVLAGLVLIVVLLVLTINALFGGGDGKSAGGTPDPSAPPTSAPVSPTSPAPTKATPATHTTASTTTAGSSSGSSSGTSAPATTGSASSPVTPPKCTTAQLKIAAVPSKASFAVGSKPDLALRVLNTGTGPCVQDVSDSNIELRVYNGAARVWGSRDCATQPGTNPQQLVPERPVTFSIQWSGMSSTPNCEGTRQMVGAGTYTLYATLDGKDGSAATFQLK